MDRILTENPDVDFVQLQINYLDWEHPVIQSRRCYETAVAHNKPIIVMEPIKGGTLANPPQKAMELIRQFDADVTPPSLALRYAASLEHVFMVLSGMGNICQVDENTKVMSEFQPLSKQEEELLMNVATSINEDTAVSCTSCGYCKIGRAHV